MTSRSYALVAPLLLLALATGCSIDLQHGLTEQDANEIYVLLSKNGISATKHVEEGGQEVRFTIQVPKADAARAAELLRENSLPRPMEKGFSHFAKGSMVPTAAEERAMMLKAIGGEVSNALNKIDGVLESNVIVNIPENNDLTQPENKPLPSASVMVRYRPTVDGKPPVTEEAVKQFVAGAVQELKPESVIVLLTPSMSALVDAASAENRLQEVFGLRMTASSASQFRVMVAVSALFILAMIALSAWTFMRGSSAPRPSRSRARPEA